MEPSRRLQVTRTNVAHRPEISTGANIFIYVCKNLAQTSPQQWISAEIQAHS